MKNTALWDLLRKLLPGLLPLLIFIAADEIWGTQIGLIIAIITGIIELLAIGIKEKRLDGFVIFDTLLLVAMGGISLWLDNAIFFKLKPAFINLIFCLLLGVSAFSPKNILLMYSQRMMKGIEINPQQEFAMRRMIRILFWFFLAYTALVIYSAFFMSKEAWAFISGGLFYILFGVLFAWQLIVQRIRRRS